MELTSHVNMLIATCFLNNFTECLGIAKTSYNYRNTHKWSQQVCFLSIASRWRQLYDKQPFWKLLGKLSTDTDANNDNDDDDDKSWSYRLIFA